MSLVLSGAAVRDFAVEIRAACRSTYQWRLRILRFPRKRGPATIISVFGRSEVEILMPSISKDVRSNTRRASGWLATAVRPFVVCALLVAAAITGQSQIDFDKPKPIKPLPNPMLVTASRDQVRNAAKQMLETRETPLEREDCNQQTGECILVTKAVEFIRGITTKSQLEHYCDIRSADVRSWAKGRYSLRIQISPAGTETAQVGVYARFEGDADDAVGQQWVPLTSKGVLEDALLRCLDERIRGGLCKDETR